MNAAISVISGALLDTSSVMVVLLLYRYVFGTDLNLNLKKIAVLAGLHMVMSIICHSVLPEGSAACCVVLFVAITLFVFGREKKWKLFFYAIPVLLLYSNNVMYMNMVVTTLGLPDFFYYYSDIIVLLPLLILWAIRVERRQISFSLNIGALLFISVYSFMGNFYLEVSRMIELGVLPEKKPRVYQIVWLLFVTIIHVCVIVMFVYYNKHAYEKQISHLYQKYFEQEYQAFREKSERQHELDRLRHDWKNHVNTVQAMWERGEADKTIQYVAGLAEESRQHTYKILSGNEVADAILNLKYETAQRAGIEFEVKGRLSGLAALEPVDICVLLGNALDNALEACGKEERERYIRLTASENQGYLHMVIENTLHAPVTFKNNRPVTSKKNSFEHGFGLLGMEHVVHKYQGDLRFEIVEGLFKVQVILPMQVA